MTLIKRVEKAADSDLVREMFLQPVVKRPFDPVDRMNAKEGWRLAFAADRMTDAETQTCAAKRARTPLRRPSATDIGNGTGGGGSETVQ